MRSIFTLYYSKIGGDLCERDKITTFAFGK